MCVCVRAREPVRAFEALGARPEQPRCVARARLQRGRYVALRARARLQRGAAQVEQPQPHVVLGRAHIHLHHLVHLRGAGII